MVGRHESSSQLKPVCHLNVIYLSRCAPRHRPFSRWNWRCEASAAPARLLRSIASGVGAFEFADRSSEPPRIAYRRFRRRFAVQGITNEGTGFLSKTTRPFLIFGTSRTKSRFVLGITQAVPLLSPKSTNRPCRYDLARRCPQYAKVAGISNHRLFPRRAPLGGGEPSH